jgi:cleavage and polyadenylation specificity factor subunit 1
MNSHFFSRLKEYKDTVRLIIFTLDLVTHHYPVITSVDGLPYDCMSMLPCPTSLGGVLVLAGNSMIYVDQAARRVALPVNGWLARSSDIPLPVPSPDEASRKLELEGCRAAFVDHRTVFVVLQDGIVYPVELVTDGKTVTKLSMSPALARTTVPALIKPVGDDRLFVGSTAGSSVLLKAVRVEEEITSDRDATSAPSAVVDVHLDMMMDDDDGQYT